MEYKCKIISINQLIASTQGFVMPLCQSCKTRDCSNPIEKKKISIVGIKKEMRAYCRGNNVSFVVNCEGYVNL